MTQEKVPFAIAEQFALAIQTVNPIPIGRLIIVEHASGMNAFRGRVLCILRHGTYAEPEAVLCGSLSSELLPPIHIEWVEDFRAL